MSNYRKTMADALREMYPLTEETQIDEGTIDKVKEIASKKQAMKIDGVMVDSFTASAISQIYDKVNDNIKKKMDSLPITKLANLAMKMMQKNDYVPEEVDLDEGTKQVLAHGGKGKYKVTKDGDKIEIKFGGKVVGTADFDRGADSFFVSIKGEKGQKSFDDAQAIADYFAKNKITEEVDLDEDFSVEVPKQKIAGKTYGGGATVIVKAKTASQAIKMVAKRLDVDVNLLKTGKVVKEEVDLDEGKMSQLHQHIKDKKSPEEIAKMMKLDVKTVKALMAGYMSSSKMMASYESYEIGTDEYREHTQEVTPGQEITDFQRFKVESMKEALAKVWGLDESKKEEKSLTKKVKGGKTMTGDNADEIDLKPEIKEK